MAPGDTDCWVYPSQHRLQVGIPPQLFRTGNWSRLNHPASGHREVALLTHCAPWSVSGPDGYFSRRTQVEIFGTLA
jgi:hypothetical protein